MAMVPSPSPISRVVETAVYVSDLGQSRELYCAVLGAHGQLHTPPHHPRRIRGEIVLRQFQRGATQEPLQTPGGVVPPHGADGVQHFAFAIAPNALASWREHLTGAGIKIESEVRWPRGGRSLYLRDPDNHSVELITPGLWEIY